MIEVKVAEVSISNIGFALFLKPLAEKYNKILPIFIGRLELHSIQSVLEGITPPRPMSHDLFVNTLVELGARVQKINIIKIKENTFYAELVLESAGKNIVIDARPSDCIALALRQNASIFVAESVYEEAGVEIEGGEGGADESDFSEFKTQEQVLQDRLKYALKMENYEEAANIRDQLKSIRNEN